MPTFKFAAALPATAALMLLSGNAHANTELYKTKCSYTYNRTPPVHTECLVTSSMSQGAQAKIVVTRDSKRFISHNEGPAIPGHMKEAETWLLNGKREVGNNHNTAHRECHQNRQVEICLDGPIIHWWAEDDSLSPESLWKISQIIEEILNEHGLKTNDAETQVSDREAFPLKAGDDPITDEVLKEHGLKLVSVQGLGYLPIFVPIGPGSNPTMDEVLKKLTKHGLELDSTGASAPIGPGGD
jgi:hypothetical protein